MKNYTARTEYPSDGAVVEQLIDNGNGTLTIIYNDGTYLIVEKVKP